MTLIAQQGGYLRRKCDGPPGFECLWRGYIKFEAMVHITRLHLRRLGERVDTLCYRTIMGKAQS